MRKWNKKTKIAVFIIFLILAVLFAALCWKKRRGIYNTYKKEGKNMDIMTRN